MKKILIPIIVVIVGFISLNLYDKTQSVSIKNIQQYDESAIEILKDEKNDILDMDIVLYKNSHDHICMMGLKNKKMIISSQNNQTQSKDLDIYSFSHQDQTVGIIFGDNSKKHKEITYSIDYGPNYTSYPTVTKTISVDPNDQYILEFVFVDGNSKTLTLPVK